MRCLVTGATGHIGSFLTRLLVERGHSVSALIRPSSDLWRLDGVTDRIHVIQGDLANLSSAEARLLEAAPETVFHLAWCGVTTDTRNVPENAAASVAGSLELFRIAKTAGCRCWVSLGSQAEDVPDTPYGAAKLTLCRALEPLCQEAAIRLVWLRLLAAYGPADDPRHLIPFVITRLLAGEVPVLTSTGAQQWDYLYVEDAVEAIYRAAVSPSVQGVYYLASGELSTVRALVERIRDLIHPALPLRFGDVTVPSMRGDVTPLRAALNWVPQTSLDTGLKKTLEWHRSRKQNS